MYSNVLCHDNSAIRLPKTSTHGSRTADSLAFTCIPNLIQECLFFSLEYFREIANKWEKKSKLFTSQFIGHITRQKLKEQRLKSNILAHLKTIFARIGYFFKSKNMVIVIVSCLHFNGGDENHMVSANVISDV